MSRTSCVLVMALCAVIAMQAWRIHTLDAANAGQSSVRRHVAEAMDAPQGPSSRQASDAVQDKRPPLLPTHRSSVAGSHSPWAANDTAVQRVADNMLISMLPSRSLGGEQLVTFQLALGQMPPDQRFHVLKAFARAINEGRIQPKQ